MTSSYTYTGSPLGIDPQAAWEYVRNGYLFSPRTVLKGRRKVAPDALPAVDGGLDDLSRKLQQTLDTGLGRMDGEKRAVMFSGGFDSMLIACMARRAGAQVTAVTVQFDDFNPLTVAGAVEFAAKAAIKHQVLSVKAVEFLSAFENLAALTDEPVLDLDLAIVYAALKKYDPRCGGKVFISGMGSDQWFGDMALEEIPGGPAARLDWALVDVGAHHRAAQAHGCQFVFPFLSPDMLALSRRLPPEMKKDKKLLRALAVASDIPHRGLRSEVQVPALMRQILIKMYGERAWPSPVSPEDMRTRRTDELLRQIVLGLWLEKALQKTMV